MVQPSKLTREDLIEVLSSKNINYYELNYLDKSSILVVPAFGGRILGTFFNSKNLLWINKASFDDWNKGGHRSWYAPEWSKKSIYIFDGPESWQVPSQMDPGNYKVIEYQVDKLIAMRSDFEVETCDHTPYSLSFTRKIILDDQEEYENSFPMLKDIQGLRHISISFEHKLKNRTSKTISKEIGLWSILQVAPPGDVIVPLSSLKDRFYYDYYEPLSSERIKISKDCFFVSVDGEERFKIGFPPNKTMGKIGYLPKTEDEESYFILKSFSNYPERQYIDKPKNDKRLSGDVIQIYNHFEGGDLAFSELECHAPAETILPDKEQAFSIKLLFLFSSRKIINQAISQLVGEMPGLS